MVREGRLMLLANLTPALQGAPLWSKEHILEVQLYVIVNSRHSWIWCCISTEDNVSKVWQHHEKRQQIWVNKWKTSISISPRIRDLKTMQHWFLEYPSIQVPQKTKIKRIKQDSIKWSFAKLQLSHFNLKINGINWKTSSRPINFPIFLHSSFCYIGLPFDNYFFIGLHK